MTHSNNGRCRRAALTAVLTTLTMIAATPMAVAQEPVSATAQQQINIPAGPLDDALISVSETFGVIVIAPNELVTGKMSPGVSGALNAEQAIDALLVGSGLDLTRSSTGAYVIVQQTAQAAQTRLARTAETGVAQEEPLVVESIIVTGTKQDIGVQDTVESVEIFTAKRLDEENLFNLKDALARTPNVSVIGDNLGDISIRGINRLGTNESGEGVAINVFQDGAPLSNGALGFGSSSVWDVEQLEVLRGSQSTVQGRNSIAGAIVLTSKQPTFDWEAIGRLRYAEFGTLQTAAAVSGPLIADQVAFRVSVDHQESDGFITDGLSDDPFDFRESLTVRGRFLIEPEAIDGFSALLTVEYNDRLNGNAPLLFSEPGDFIFDPEDLRSFSDNLIQNEFESWKVIADITYEFSDSVTLKLLGTYEDSTTVTSTTSRTPNQFLDIGLFAEAFADIYSAEARLEFDFGKLTGFVGGYYFSSKTEEIALTNEVIADFVPFLLNPFDSALILGGRGFQDVENFAFFTSWRYEPSDKWTLDFALRYDDEGFSSRRDPATIEVVPDTCTATVPGFVLGTPTVPLVTVPCAALAGAFLPTPEPRQSDSLGVLLPSGSITYHINEDASVFVGYRRGYRAGGTFLSFVLTDLAPREVVAYDPEFLDTFEAGWRTQWLDGRLTVNGTLFYSEYEDQQIRFTNELGFPIIDNAGATSLYGLELSVNFQPTQALNLFASLGLLQTNVDEFIFQEDDPTTPENEFLDLAGNELSRSPSVSFNLSANYQSQSGYFAGASLNYESAYFSTIFNLDEAVLGNELTEKVDAAVIVNAQVGYTFNDAVTITVYANNLFNERAPETIRISSFNALLGPDDLTDRVFRFGVRQPQTFGITIDARF